MVQEVKIVSIKPIGHYASGDPMYEFHTSLPSRNVRVLERPKETPQEAFAAGEKFIKDYERSTHPCGMGVVIGVTELADGKFDAVINTYYSNT